MADVSLIDAMLAWNTSERGGGAMVVRWPDQPNAAREFGRSDCACMSGWPEAGHDGRMAWLMGVAWQAVARDGVTVADMHDALLAIPEFRASMTSDMLPEDEQANFYRWPAGTRVKVRASSHRRHGEAGSLVFGTSDLGDGGTVLFDDGRQGSFGPGELLEVRR